MEFCKCCGQPIQECCDRFYDDDENEGYGELDREEQDEADELEKLDCICGAYYLGKDGRVHQVADCCCGRG